MLKGNNVKGFFSLLLTAAVYGSFGIYIRFLSQELTTYQQIVFRNIFAFLFTLLILVLVRKYKASSIRRENVFLLVAFSIIVPLAVMLYVFAILGTKIAIATFAFFAGTIVTSWILGITKFKEKISGVDIASLTLVLLGLVLLAYPFSSSSLNLGFLLGIISGCVDSVGHLFRKRLSGEIDNFFLVLLTTIGGVVISGLMIIYSGDKMYFLKDLTPLTWLIGIFFGFLLVVVNFFLLVGFQNFDLSLGSIVLSSELFFAIIFGLLFLGEMPTNKELVGGVFILFASVLPSLAEIRKNSINL